MSRVNFKSGYVFGKRIDGTYLLSKCEPLENCRFGVVKYPYEKSKYLRITEDELDMLNSGYAQWIDHEHMIGDDSNLCFANTIGEAIEKYREKESLPYMASESEMEAMASENSIPMYLMTADQLNEKLNDDNLHEVLMYDETIDDLFCLNS